MADNRQQYRQDQDKVIIRLPDGMRDAIKASAKANNRSANAEIVARLEASAEEQRTLRDWFAGQALAGLLASGATYGGKTDDRGAISADAYLHADAMLAERAKGGAK